MPTRHLLVRTEGMEPSLLTSLPGLEQSQHVLTSL